MLQRLLCQVALPRTFCLDLVEKYRHEKGERVQVCPSSPALPPVLQAAI